ncbi:MAG: MATE family efflux transporter [Clostridia bacterium]|nr:MATE family efflux transporter [Clostridia bacterium]
MNEKGRTRREIAALMIPLVMENALQILAGVVTAAMIGRMLTLDISAQGISNRVTNMMWSAFKGVGIGATMIAAVYYGENRLDKCRRTMEQAYLLAVPVSVLIAVVIFLVPQPIMSFFTDDAELIERAVEYMRISVWMIPFAATTSLNTAAFNSRGNTKTPLLIAIMMNLINITLGYVLIFGIGGFAGLGIHGAAIAAVVSQAFSCFAGLALLYSPRGFYGGTKSGGRFFSLESEYVKNLLSTGLPAAGENMFWPISAVLVSKVILSYGTVYYAAYQQGLQAESLSQIPMIGFTTTATALAARAIGMGDSKQFKLYFTEMKKIAWTIGAAVSLLLLLMPEQLMRLLTDKEDVIEIGKHYIFLMSFTELPQALFTTYYGFIRAAGHKRAPMFITGTGVWLIRVPLIYLLGWFMKVDIRFIWGVMIADAVSRMVLSMLYAKKKNVLGAVEQAAAKNG